METEVRSQESGVRSQESGVRELRIDGGFPSPNSSSMEVDESPVTDPCHRSLSPILQLLTPELLTSVFTHTQLESFHCISCLRE